MFDHQWYEGTIITYCHEKRNYGIYWEDGDSEVGDLSVTLRRIEDWYIKTGQQAVGARIQSGAPFALMHFHHDSLERKAAMRGAFIFLASKHTLEDLTPYFEKDPSGFSKDEFFDKSSSSKPSLLSDKKLAAKQRNLLWTFVSPELPPTM